LFIGEVRTIRNETTYPIHEKYPLNQATAQSRASDLRLSRASLPLIWNKNEEYKARADDIDPTQRLGIAHSWRENFLI
ncbi:MAG: hypothetical protein ACI4BG_04820, partial [Prevotella sp.]